MRPASASSLMCCSGAICLHARQRNSAPLPTFGGSSGPRLPELIVNSIDGGVTLRFTVGSTHACFPAFFDNQNELTSGICAPHAGLGQITVRAQSHAITVASPPPCSLGSVTFG